MNELTSNGVQIYQFPTDDETVADINNAMNVSNFKSTWNLLDFFRFCYWNCLELYDDENILLSKRVLLRQKII
jgi:hypothetical protein